MPPLVLRTGIEPRFTSFITLRRGVAKLHPRARILTSLKDQRGTGKTCAPLVLRTGIEPAISAVKGRRPGPLDDRSVREEIMAERAFRMLLSPNLRR